MKGKRLTATMLALLLMVSLLPMAAMADDLPDNSVGQVPINQPIGTNIGTGVEINTNGSVQTNSGSVAENRGTVVNNNGTVVGNMDGGTVENNNAGATVQYNYAGATVENNKVNATVIDNHGLVGKKDENGNLMIGGSSGNSGTVENNKKGGIVTNNIGTVRNNEKDGRVYNSSGTVENNKEGGVVAYNSGTVEKNESGGTVMSNSAGGTVENNNAGATVEYNHGLVGKKDANGNLITDGSYGNSGTVENNKKGGIVAYNSGTVENNKKGGIVAYNTGTVENNKKGGIVTNNTGIVENNEKGGIVTNNTGTVKNNMTGGTVVNNNAGGTVHNIGGEVGSNSGMVFNNTAGSVVKVNEVDGVVTNHSSGPKVEINFGTVDYHSYGNNKPQTYYGVHYEVDGKKVYIDQFKETTEVTISELNISRPGFKLVNCQAVEAFAGGEENPFEDVTNNVDFTTKDEDGYVRSFTVWAPTRLKLFWEKIVTAVESNEPEAKPVNLPSTVAAEDVKVGTVVRVKGQLFRVIEMDDGSMTVVTMGKLSKKDMEDLMAFLAKYFTPEQIELLLGDPELISGALAEELFGGNTGHIVFKAARNLFA